MRVRYFILLLSFLLFSCTESREVDQAAELIQSGEIEIKISPSSKSIRTCDLLELSIELKYPQTYKVKLPDSKDDFGDFLVYQIHQNSSVAINEKLNFLSQVIILEPGLPADHRIPSLSFNFWNDKNEQSILKSKAQSIAVTSILTAGKNTDIEDIITETDNANHSVAIIGTVALLSTVTYFVFFCKVDEEEKDKALKEALNNFHSLEKLADKELLRELPKACCLFLKERYKIQSLPNNLDVIIKALSDKNEQLSKKLTTLNDSYIKLRYSSEATDKKELADLYSSFDSLFEEIKS